MAEILTPLARLITNGQPHQMMTVALAIVVFVSAMVIDFAEAQYVRAVNKEHAHSAALWSLVMYAVGALGFVAVINVSLWLMIPEGLGFYVGTRLALSKRLTIPVAVARFLHGARKTD